MDKKIGFIGCGNMGSAMIKGMLDLGVCRPEDITASTKGMASKEKMEKELDIHIVETNQSVVESADIVFLAVKPAQYEDVIGEIKDFTREGQCFVSMAPGKKLEWLEGLFGKPMKLIRTMPNTPAMVGKGMTAFCVNEQVDSVEKERIFTLLRSFGNVQEVDEHLMDVVTAVSGSSPAYVFILIEAMADAAVAGGMPRKQAYIFAAQAVYGSAAMVLETGRHPAQLKDMVCSPGGTTIEAVRVLEQKGFRSDVFEAMVACMEKSREM